MMSMRKVAVTVGILAATFFVRHAGAANEVIPEPVQVVSPAAGISPTTDPEAFTQLKWDTSRKGRPLDLRQYKRNFQDDVKIDMIVKNVSAYQPTQPYSGP